MKKIFGFVFLYFSLSFGEGWGEVAYAQTIDLQNSHWELGYKYALDFSSGTVKIDSSNANYIGEAEAVISDNRGNLLFYSDGNIRNKIGKIILNDSFYNHGFYSDKYWSYLPVSRPQIIIPFPSDTNKFYLFYINLEYNDSGEFIPSKCRFAVLDKQMNSGLGGVVYYDSLLLQDTLMQGNLSAIKHGNGKDWWLLIRKHRSNKFYKYLIDAAGIHTPLVQYLGIPFNAKNLPADFQGCVSNDGSKIAYIAQGTSDSLFMNRMEIYDFDRCTGSLIHYYYHSDTFNLFYPHDTLSFFGSSISPNGRYFYVSNTLILFQFDLQATDIYSTKTKVARCLSGSGNSFFEHQLGIDGKIYLCTYGGNEYLHVINSPDLAGVACNFGLNQIYNHNNYTQGGLPNTANCALGAIAPCGNVGVEEVAMTKEGLVISPNPCREKLSVIGNQLSENTKVEVYDVLGRLKLNPAAIPPSKGVRGMFEIEVSSLPAGIYFLKINDDKGFVQTAKFVKE